MKITHETDILKLKYTFNLNEFLTVDKYISTMYNVHSVWNRIE